MVRLSFSNELKPINKFCRIYKEKYQDDEEVTGPSVPEPRLSSETQKEKKNKHHIFGRNKS
jgi:hypothetical protein